MKLARLDSARSWLARLVGGGLLRAIAVYQRLLSPVLPAVFGPACGCRFYPTCSHYAAEAVRVHGPGRGAWLALRRLVRCTPLSAGGHDPVPLPSPRRASLPPVCARVARTST